MHNVILDDIFFLKNIKLYLQQQQERKEFFLKMALMGKIKCYSYIAADSEYVLQNAGFVMFCFVMFCFVIVSWWRTRGQQFDK